MRSYGRSHIGLIKKENQDSFYNQDSPNGCLPNLYVIADGMGGRFGGALASKMTVDTIIYKTLNEDIEIPKETLINSVVGANEKVYNYAVENSEYYGMGSTVDAFYIDENINIVHVGDSSVFLHRKGKLIKLTHDHSKVQALLDNKCITMEEARNHNENHIITRAIGPEKYVKYDYIEQKIQENDLILACSDGLNKIVYPEQIEGIINSFCKDNESIDLEKISESLIDKALENGGVDNITVLAVNVNN